ncbi:hypothetical protein D3C75_262400 [compost metagenome]
MSRFPWKNTSEDIANQRPSQWETPSGAQEKANKAEQNAKDYTDAHSEAGAEINQNAYSVVNGIQATSKTDSIDIEAGTGIIVTPVPTEKKVRITAGGTSIPGLHGVEHVGHGADPIPEATLSVSGLMSPSHVAQLADVVTDMYRVVDLFAMSGQSNMQGQSEAAPAPFEIPQHRAYEYKLLTDSLETVKHPFGENIDDLLAQAVNGWGSLSPRFADAYYSTSGTPPLMVGVAKGATVVTDWIGNTRYAKVVEKVNGAVSRAMSSGLIVRNKYFVWLQGESDGITNTTKQVYKQSFLQLWNALKQDCGFTKCLIIRVAKFYDYNVIPIIKAQEELSREHDDIVMLTRETGYFTVENGFMQSIWHYTNSGLDRAGTYAGREAGKYVNTSSRPVLGGEPYPEAVVAGQGQYGWNFRDGSMSGGITLSNIGNPIVFEKVTLDGNSGFRLSKDINLDGDATLSITCLFDTPTVGGGLLFSYDGSVERDFIFYYLLEKTINIVDPSGNPTVKFTQTDSFTPNLGTYNHFVVQKSGRIYSLYVNGKQIQTIFSGPKVLNINTLFFGDEMLGIKGKVKHAMISKGSLIPPKECDPVFYFNNEQGTS